MAGGGLLVATLERWRADPVAFVRECFDVGEPVKPDAWQVDALRAFVQGDRLALVACKNPGKTAVLAWLVLNFLITRPHAKIGCVAITGDNLRDNLWAELAKWRQRSRILSHLTTWTKTRLFVNESPSTWFVTARAFAKSADPQQQAEALAGLHADYVMFVLDESGGMPQAVMVTAEAVLGSGLEAKVVQAGNPSAPDGPLHRAAVTDRALWHVIRVTGDPDDPKRAPRVSLEWAKQQIAAYGRDNPWVMVNVLGLFPPAAFNALLGTDEVEEAMKRKLRASAYEWAQRRLGVDVARFGDDRTVLFPRQGLRAFLPKIVKHARGSAVSTDIATAVISAKASWRSELELLDATGGWAAGARDVLLTAGVPVIELNFGGKALDPRYENQRAELWFLMARWVKGGGWLPNVPELVAELVTPTYTFSPTGKFLVEPKQLVKERMGRSPDLADALGTTFGLPEMPAEIVAQQRLGGGGRAAVDFDPFDYGRGLRDGGE